MAHNTQYKRVTVKEDPKTALVEAGINTVRLPDGGNLRVLCVGHAYFPNHDRALADLVLQAARDLKPDVTILAGGMIDEDAFKALVDEEDNYLHEYAEAPEVLAAKEKLSFEDKVLALGKPCGDFVKSFADASGGKVIYIPSATHLSMGNEVRLMEYIQTKKKILDHWTDNHPEAQDKPSDPKVDLPKKLAALIGVADDPRITVLRYGAAVKIGDTLFMIGDFRRRNAGDAAKVEWEQRRLNVVRSFDGKVSSGWQTTADHTMPGLRLNHWEFHEVGYLWDATRKGENRDYDRRAPGFWVGSFVNGTLFGSSVVFRRGVDGRRFCTLDLPDGSYRAYTEETPGALPNGEEISLAGAAQATTASKKPARAKGARKSGSGRKRQ